MASLSVSAITDAIRLGELIHTNGLDGKKLSQVADAKKNQILYRSVFHTPSDRYKGQHGSSPNVLMAKPLHLYAETSLKELCDVESYHFYGHKIHTYVWAAITKIDSSRKELKSSFHPQIYILISRLGIRFGFDYGSWVDDNQPMVQMVRDSPKLQQDIVALLKKDTSIRLYSCVSGDSPKEEDRLEVHSASDVQNKWTKDSHLIKYIPQTELEKRDPDEDLWPEIKRVLDELLPLFQVTSEFDIHELSKEVDGKESPKKELPKIVTETKPNDEELHTYADHSSRLNDIDFDKLPDVGKVLLFQDSEILIRRIVGALKDKHVILTGPPGTGKSELAEQICKHYRGVGGYKTFTAAPDWSTFETIGGYRQQGDNTLKLVL